MCKISFLHNSRVRVLCNIKGAKKPPALFARVADEYCCLVLFRGEGTVFDNDVIKLRSAGEHDLNV